LARDLIFTVPFRGFRLLAGSPSGLHTGRDIGGAPHGVPPIFQSAGMAERRNPMKALFKSFWTDESGQGLTEYALIIALVSIGVIAVLYIFRNEIGRIFSRIANTLRGAPTNTYTPG